jgi:hypothetical protein
MNLHRLSAVVALLAALSAAAIAQAAENPDSLAATRDLARAGARQFALQRVEALQPPAITVMSAQGAASGALPATSFIASWGDWERLRLQLLSETGAHEQLLRRVAAMPAGVDPAVAADLHFAAARAAMALGRGAAARDQAGRALWAMALEGSRLRELRLLVIRSLVLDGKADDAYRSMLRFQQDYRPLDAATAALFVDGLLDLGRVREGIDWLGLLEERGPTKMRLRLHTGLLAPAEVLGQARTAIGRSEDPAWWRVLLDAAGLHSAPLLRLEALEQRLDIADAGVADPRGLWEAYRRYARDAANEHRLLAGDESNWLDFALRRRDADPVLARAYFAYLARDAGDATLRRTAQTQLAEALAAARLPRTALRLFGLWPGDPQQLPAGARQVLGGLSANLPDHPLALRYWLGLPAPEGMPPAIWELRLAALALRAGRSGAAAGIAQRITADSAAAIPQAQLAEWVTLAEQFADHGRHDVARLLFGRVLPDLTAQQAAGLRAGIGLDPGAGKLPPPSAESYLLAALKAPDAGDASGLRMVAGFSLLRAGLLEDARAQFEWVLKHARDPAQIAVARRELGF